MGPHEGWQTRSPNGHPRTGRHRGIGPRQPSQGKEAYAGLGRRDRTAIRCRGTAKKLAHTSNTVRLEGRKHAWRLLDGLYIAMRTASRVLREVERSSRREDSAASGRRGTRDAAQVSSAASRQRTSHCSCACTSGAVTAKFGSGVGRTPCCDRQRRTAAHGSLGPRARVRRDASRAHTGFIRARRAGAPSRSRRGRR